MDNSIYKNGLTRKELLLLTPFANEPWREFTTTEIKKITKNKSHQQAFSSLKKLAELKIINEEMKGNNNTYKINPEITSIHHLASVEYIKREKRNDIPLKNIEKIMKAINNQFYVLLIGGSYAEGTQNKSSDLDVAIIIPDTDNKKPYESAFMQGELFIPEIHGFVFTSEEFVQMLTNDEFNFGKELAKKHIIYYGAEQYYKILFEAMNYGFKIRHVYEKGKIGAGIRKDSVRRFKRRKNKRISKTL